MSFDYQAIEYDPDFRGWFPEFKEAHPLIITDQDVMDYLIIVKLTVDDPDKWNIGLARYMLELIHELKLLKRFEEIYDYS